jgi:glycosyltransferase involved in cell wall biosynthesis
VSFGVVNAVKQYAFVLEAFPVVMARCPEARLAFVGPCADADREELLTLATALGVADRVTVTGAVTAPEYATWLDRAAIAVQLRRTANGESSAAVADCLAAGAVLVVTGIGAGRDLPEAAVVRVGPTVAAGELATVIADLLGDPERRSALAAAARAYASQHSFAIVASRLFQDVIEPATRAGFSVARLT